MRAEEYTTDTLLSILVEVTTFCNMGCAGCVRTVHRAENRWANQHLSAGDFARMVSTLPPAHEIVTQGVGEPTMNPDLPEILRIARESGKFPHITMTTNGMVRPVGYYAGLFNAGLSRLYISVDSLDPELANRLREGTSVPRLTHLIRTLAVSFPGRIAIRTSVGRNNAHSVPALLAGLNELGRLRVNMHPYDDMGNPDGVMTGGEREAFERGLPDLVRPLTNLRVISNNFVPSPAVCMHPWQIPAVTVDGYLTPCCRMTDKSVFTFGNMLASSFRDVWDSEAAWEMRRRFVVKSPAFCAGCPRFAPRPPSPPPVPTQAGTSTLIPLRLACGEAETQNAR